MTFPRVRSTSDMSADAGMTLVELLVAMGIAAVLGTLIATTAIITTRTTDHVQSMAESTAVARAAQDRVLALLRAAIHQPSSNETSLPIFDRVDVDDITFFTQHDRRPGQPPMRVRLWIDNQGRLREQVVLPTGSGPNWSYTGSGTTRTVAHDVVPPSSDGSGTRFEFYTDASVNAPPPMPISGPITSDGVLSTIEAVGVTLAVNTDRGERADPVVLNGRVTLHNRID